MGKDRSCKQKKGARLKGNLENKDKLKKSKKTDGQPFCNIMKREIKTLTTTGTSS